MNNIIGKKEILHGMLRFVMLFTGIILHKLLCHLKLESDICDCSVTVLTTFRKSSFSLNLEYKMIEFKNHDIIKWFLKSLAVCISALIHVSSVLDHRYV